jgi:uncharacterized protein YceH (UPF0502 family)
MDLDAAEVRVLGCLIEKQRTTPDVYPLSLNGLRAACNQATNRDPVVAYDDDTLRDALHRLGRRGWTRLASGARAAKYRHLLDEKPGLARDEQAVLAVLMLRGPQTLNEIRTRTERMQPFAGSAELVSVLGRLGERGFAELQPRRPGQKEQRYAHLLSSDLDDDRDGGERPAPAPAATFTPPSQQAPAPSPDVADPLAERVDRLESDLAELAQQVAQLRAALGE